MDSALRESLAQQIIELCDPVPGRGFYSPIFPRYKNDGLARIILNLKCFTLNEHVKNFHFKMDTIKEVLYLVQRGYFMGSIDFKYAYYSVRAVP